MQWQDSHYVLPLIIASAVSVAIACFVWRRRGSPGATPLVFLLLAAAVWQFGYALVLGSTDLSTKVLCAKVGYLGIVTAPTAWLAVTLQYTRRGRWVTPRNLALLTIAPIVTLLLAWTNEGHGLIWSTIRLDANDP